MRRVSMFLTMLILAALLLAACGGEETTTSVPSTNVPPVTVDATATTDLGEGTATADGTQTADGSDMTTTPAVPVTGEESPNRVTNLLDFGVWNQNGEQIGDVEDMVLDMDNTMIAYVIVGTGGFLDLGEKEVAVPWEMLELQAGTDNATGGQQNAFVFTGDEEFYKNAPDTDITSMMPGIGQPAEDWDADIRNFWQSGVALEAGTANTPAADGTASPAAEATAAVTTEAPAASTTETQGTNQGQGQGQDLQGVLLASDVIGSTIQVRGNDQALNNGANQGAGTVAPQGTAATDATAVPQATAGADQGAGTDTGTAEDMDVTVDDIIVNPDTGEIQYLVVVGGFVDGERWIPVPVGFLQWDETNQSFLLRVNAAALQNAPVFEGGEYPDMSAEGWDSGFDTFWQNPDAGGTGTSSGGVTVATATP